MFEPGSLDTGLAVLFQYISPIMIAKWCLGLGVGVAGLVTVRRVVRLFQRTIEPTSFVGGLLLLACIAVAMTSYVGVSATKFDLDIYTGEAKSTLEPYFSHRTAYVLNKVSDPLAVVFGVLSVLGVIVNCAIVSEFGLIRKAPTEAAKEPGPVSKMLEGPDPAKSLAKAQEQLAKIQEALNTLTRSKG